MKYKWVKCQNNPWYTQYAYILLGTLAILMLSSEDRTTDDSTTDVAEQSIYRYFVSLQESNLEKL